MKQVVHEPLLVITDMVIKRGNGFSLRIPSLGIVPGRVGCIVGANGCGKTTLLEVVVGLLRPTTGTVTIAGRKQAVPGNYAYLKRTIGFVPDDEAWIIPELTANEYFSLLAQIYKRSHVQHDLLQDVRNLAKALQFSQGDQLLGSLSHGNAKKVQLIAGLMHRPRLLVVDELRNGLDPIAIKQAEKLLVEQKKSGTAILAATHDLWWAERFADDIIMVQEGRLILQDTTDHIVQTAGSVEAKFMELYAS